MVVGRGVAVTFPPRSCGGAALVLFGGAPLWVGEFDRSSRQVTICVVELVGPRSVMAVVVV